MAAIKLFLDTRYKSKDKEKQGLYPVKLRVFQANPRKQKLYNLPNKVFVSKSDFKDLMNKDKKLRGEKKEMREEIFEVESDALKAEKTIVPFDFYAFELKMFEKTNDVDLVKTFYDKRIDRMNKEGRIGTADNYLNSKKSIKYFLDGDPTKDKNPYSGNNEFERFDNLKFHHITVDFLRAYEAFMLSNDKSRSTIGAYLRPLRSLYNDAIENNIAPASSYPFHKKKYQIPATQSVKKAFNKHDLKALFHAQPLNEYEEKARDFFFIVYLLNGINIKDLALLKWKNISGDKMEYYRAKTINTTAGRLKSIKAHIVPKAMDLIKKHGTTPNPNSLVFDIINVAMRPEEQHRRIKLFTKFLNTYLKQLAKRISIDENISIYWARHSAASNSLNSGVSIEIISQALGHSNLGTTRAYLNVLDTKYEEMARTNDEFLNN